MELIMKSALFIDDEQNVLNSFKRSMMKEKEWLKTYYAQNYQSAQEILQTESIDVVIADYKMPEKDGLSLLNEIKEKYPNIYRILLTGSLESEIAKQAEQIVHHFLNKPCKADEIVKVIKSI